MASPWAKVTTYNVNREVPQREVESRCYLHKPSHRWPKALPKRETAKLLHSAQVRHWNLKHAKGNDPILGTSHRDEAPWFTNLTSSTLKDHCRDLEDSRGVFLGNDQNTQVQTMNRNISDGKTYITSMTTTCEKRYNQPLFYYSATG